MVTCTKYTLPSGTPSPQNWCWAEQQKTRASGHLGEHVNWLINLRTLEEPLGHIHCLLLQLCSPQNAPAQASLVLFGTFYHLLGEQRIVWEDPRLWVRRPGFTSRSVHLELHCP